MLQIKNVKKKILGKILFNEKLSNYSWFNLERKINTYKNYWQRHWESLYDIKQEDVPENNMFFDKSWSDVSEDEIEELATRLSSDMGGWIFHSRVDFEKKEITLNQQEAMRRLSHQVVTQLEFRRTVIEIDSVIKSRDQIHEELAAEKARTEEMLLNILPKRIAAELKDRGAVEPRFYNSASIMFSDFSGFTNLAEQMQPKALIELLHQYFATFDNIVAKHNVEKLKTIGDAYMCVAGLPSECRGHAIAICFAALDIQNHMTRMNKQREKLRMPRWDMRIGIHSGPAIAGVVGEKKFTYDIWGDAVNTAALMEQKGEPGRVNVSETTFQQINEIFETEARGNIDSGKKGSLAMYFVNRINPEFSADSDGLKPNELFEEKFGKLMRVYEN